MTGSQEPRVTVGLPVRNGAPYLVKALDSLRSQSLRDLRIVVSDNASDDETASICQAASEADPRVRVHRWRQNIGAAANFNWVADLAETPYFAWANHDDLWHPDYLARCVGALEETPGAVLAYTRANLIDANGCLMAELRSELALDAQRPHRRLRAFHDLFIDCDRRRLWGNPEIEGMWTPVYGVIRQDALAATERIGRFISSDTVLLEELLLHGSFVEIPERLFDKRDHPKRSMRASWGFDQRLAWFNGARPSRFLFPKWRMLGARLRAVLRAPLSPTDRLLCASEMLAFYVRRGHEGKSLIKELMINVVRLTRLRRDRPGFLERRLPQVW